MLSYNDLLGIDRELFQFLGHLKGPDFHGALVHTLTQVGDDRAPQALGRLVDARLLEEASGDRFRFHDLVRLFAVERLEEDPEAARVGLKRLASWYGVTSQLMDRALRYSSPTEVLKPGEFGPGLGADKLSAVSSSLWFEHERENLVGLVGSLFEAGENDVTWRIAVQTMPFLEQRGYYDDWKRLLDIGLEAAAQSTSPSAASEIRARLAHYLQRRGEWDKALDVLETELRELSADGTLPRAQVLLLLGDVLRLKGRWNRAEVCIGEALGIYRQLGENSGEAAALNTLGHILGEQGRIEEAIDGYRQCLQIRRTLNDEPGIASTLNNLGLAFWKKQALTDAVDFLSQSRDGYRRLQDGHGEAAALVNLANVQFDLGQREIALTLQEEALNVFVAAADPHGEANVLTNLIDYYAQAQRWEESRSAFDRAIAITQRIGDLRGEALALHNLGNLHKYTGDWLMASELYARSLEQFRAAEDKPNQVMVLGNLAEVTLKRGKHEAARDLYDDGIALAHGIGDQRAEARFDLQMSNVLRELGNRELASTRAQAALALYRNLHDEHSEGLVLWNLSRDALLSGDTAECLTLTRESVAKLNPLSVEGRHAKGWLSERGPALI